MCTQGCFPKTSFVSSMSSEPHADTESASAHLNGRGRGGRGFPFFFSDPLFVSWIQRYKSQHSHTKPAPAGWEPRDLGGGIDPSALTPPARLRPCLPTSCKESAKLINGYTLYPVGTEGRLPLFGNFPTAFRFLVFQFLIKKITFSEHKT